MIFEEQIARKPNDYPWTKDYISAMWQGHWTPDEFDFQSDYQDFKVSMPSDQQEILVRTLSAIAQIEVAVKKFWARLGDNLPHPSLTDMGLVMAHIEIVHNLAYEKLLTVLGLEEVFEKNLELDIIKGRVNYLRKYLTKVYENNRKQYIYALILFTLFVENVSLFSQFYVVLWINKHHNILKETSQQVLYTSKEETIHSLIGTRLINTIREECPELFDEQLEERVKSEAEVAFKSESKIIDWILDGFSDEGISSEILKEFIKDRINRSLVDIGFGSQFDVNSELLKETEWFNAIVDGTVHTDFFHRRSISYVKGQGYSASEEWF